MKKISELKEEDDVFDYGIAKYIGTSALVVYFALCRHADNNGKAFPSVKLLTQECGLSNRLIAKSTNVLKQVGLIEIKRDKNQHNVYYIKSVRNAIQLNGWEKIAGVESTPTKSLKAENRQLRGLLNNLSGKLAEHQLAIAFRSKKHFALSVFFNNVNDTTPLNIIYVKERVIFQRDDGKNMEIDVVAESKCGRFVLVEIRKTKSKMGLKAVSDFQEKVQIYGKFLATTLILPAFLSLGGFTGEALEFCKTVGIATANKIKQY